MILLISLNQTSWERFGVYNQITVHTIMKSDLKQLSGISKSSRFRVTTLKYVIIHTFIPSLHVIGDVRLQWSNIKASGDVLLPDAQFTAS